MPLGTSLYFELGMAPEAGADLVRAESVMVRLQPEGGEPMELLGSGKRFAGRSSGWLRPRQIQQGAPRTVSLLSVYIEPGEPLKPATTYTVNVAAGSRDGAILDDTAGTWTFTTERAPEVHPLASALDLGAEPVRWHGAFFSGICNVVFCTQARELRAHLRPDGRGTEAAPKEPGATSATSG